MSQFIFTNVEQMRFLKYAWSFFGFSTWALWASIVCNSSVIFKCEISHCRYILLKFVATMKHIEFFEFVARSDLKQVIILNLFLNYLIFRLSLKRLLMEVYRVMGITLSLSSVIITYYQCASNVLLYLFNYHFIESFRCLLCPCNSL